jgi:hypothetical protein
LPPIGDTDNPVHAAAVERIRAACAGAGIAVGIHTSSVAYTRKYLAGGFQFATLGSDGGFWRALPVRTCVRHATPKVVRSKRRVIERGRAAQRFRRRRAVRRRGTVFNTGVHSVPARSE